MAGKTYREVTLEWALSLLSPPAKASRRAVAKKNAAPSTKTARPPAPPRQAEAIRARFNLTRVEQHIVELAYACESSLEVGRLARAFGDIAGRDGLTVEVLRAVLGDESEQLLGPAAALRVHGLIAVGGIPGGLPDSSSTVRLAPGLRARWDGRDLAPQELAAGIESVPPLDEKIHFPERLEQLLREAREEASAQLIKISGVGSGTGRALAASLAEGLVMPAILVDGVALQELSPQTRHALIAALRREADLAATALVVTGAAALGVALHALFAPPPSGVRSLLVLVDERSVPATPPPAGYLVRTLDLTPPPAPATAAPVAAAATPGAPPAPVVDAIDRARRQATIDAARAMGRPVPQGADPRFMQPEPQEIAPPPAPSRPPAESIVGPMRPARERGKMSSPPVARPVAAAPAAVVLDPAPPAGASPAAAGPLSASTASPSAPPLAADPATTAAAADVTAAAAAAEPATASGEPQAPANPDEGLPFLDVPAGASSADLIQIITRATNPFQRADLIGRLRGEQRDGQLVSIVRAHLKVDHPAVRAAAEEAMGRLFGPNWNRARAIPKPVQPPHSGDGGSGPPWR